MIEIIHKDITYVIGDIFKAIENNDIDVLAHQANCMSIMGSGIAKTIKEKYPDAYRVDVCDERSPPRKLGSYSLVRTPHGVVIFNLYGQFHPGPSTDYEALRLSLKSAARLLHTINPTLRVGLPLIGCGVGGGDWAVVSQILLDEFDGLDWTVFVLNQETFNKVVKNESSAAL